MGGSVSEQAPALKNPPFLNRLRRHRREMSQYHPAASPYSERESDPSRSCEPPVGKPVSANSTERFRTSSELCTNGKVRSGRLRPLTTENSSVGLALLRNSCKPFRHSDRVWPLASKMVTAEIRASLAASWRFAAGLRARRPEVGLVEVRNETIGVVGGNRAERRRRQRDRRRLYLRDFVCSNVAPTGPRENRQPSTGFAAAGNRTFSVGLAGATLFCERLHHLAERFIGRFGWSAERCTRFP